MSDDLQPARFDPDAGGKGDFKPKFPWKWVVPIGLAAVLGIGFYQWRERSKAAELKSEIAASWHQNALPVRERTQTFRETIERWVHEAVAEVPETWADPRLRLDALHTAPGVYLRVNAEHIDEGDGIAGTAMAMEGDAIPRCLGLNPTSLRGFYARQEMLDDTWLEQVEEAGDDVLRLRVLNEQLEERVRNDFPLMLDDTRAAYFLLVVQHGSDRREHPVDVFMWDLQRRAPLLRTRTRARGRLIPVRIALGPSRAGRAQPLPDRGGAADCSIASQVRAATGRPLAEVSSEFPVGEEPAPVEGEGDGEDEGEGGETPSESGAEPEPEPGAEAADP